MQTRSFGSIIISILLHAGLFLSLVFAGERVTAPKIESPVEMSTAAPEGPKTSDTPAPQPQAPVAAAPTPQPQPSSQKIAKVKSVAAPKVAVKSADAETEATPGVEIESEPADSVESAVTAPSVVAAPAIVAAPAAGISESEPLDKAEPSGGGNGGVGRSYLDLKQQPGNRPPQYPSEARLEKRQGQVQLAYYVTAEGTVRDVKILKSSGFADLDQQAASAVEKYKYVPGQEGWAEHPVNFTLKGPAEAAPSRLRTSQNN